MPAAGSACEPPPRRRRAIMCPAAPAAIQTVPPELSAAGGGSFLRAIIGTGEAPPPAWSKPQTWGTIQRAAPAAGVPEMESRTNAPLWPRVVGEVAAAAVGDMTPSHRRDCHSTGTPSPSLLKRLPTGEAGAAEWQPRRRLIAPIIFWNASRESAPLACSASRSLSCATHRPSPADLWEVGWGAGETVRSEGTREGAGGQGQGGQGEDYAG